MISRFVTLALLATYVLASSERWNDGNPGKHPSPAPSNNASPIQPKNIRRIELTDPFHASFRRGDPTNTRIVGIPDFISDSEVLTLLQEIVGEVTAIRVHRYPDGSAHAFANFGDQDRRDHALENVHRYECDLGQFILRFQIPNSAKKRPFNKTNNTSCPARVPRFRRISNETSPSNPTTISSLTTSTEFASADNDVTEQGSNGAEVGNRPSPIDNDVVQAILAIVALFDEKVAEFNQFIGQTLRDIIQSFIGWSDRDLDSLVETNELLATLRDSSRLSTVFQSDGSRNNRNNPKNQRIRILIIELVRTLRAIGVDASSFGNGSTNEPTRILRSSSSTDSAKPVSSSTGRTNELAQNLRSSSSHCIATKPGSSSTNTGSSSSSTRNLDTRTLQDLIDEYKRTEFSQTKYGRMFFKKFEETSNYKRLHGEFKCMGRTKETRKIKNFIRHFPGTQAGKCKECLDLMSTLGDTVSSTSNKNSWMKKFRILQKYINDNNEIYKHSSSFTADYQWLQKQRQKWKDGKLAAERCDLLESVGITYDRIQNRFLFGGETENDAIDDKSEEEEEENEDTDQGTDDGSTDQGTDDGRTDHTEAAQNEEEIDEVRCCRCGKNTDEHNLCQCDHCHGWLHWYCNVTYDELPDTEDPFFCDECYKDMDKDDDEDE
jgi:hypothetical protein